MPTASEARNLMPQNRVAAWVEKIDALITAAAESDRTEVRVPYEVWGSKVDSGGAPIVTAEPLASILEVYKDRGFAIREIYDCRQFVDTGVAISWAETPAPEKD